MSERLWEILRDFLGFVKMIREWDFDLMVKLFLFLDLAFLENCCIFLDLCLIYPEFLEEFVY